LPLNASMFLPKAPAAVVTSIVWHGFRLLNARIGGPASG